MTLHVERLFVTWLPSGVDGCSHAVTDEEAGRGFRMGSDPEAVCGDVVTPVSLTVAPGPRCHRCELYVRARSTMSDFDVRMAAPRRRHRKPCWLRQLFSHKHPARSGFPRPPDRAGPPRRRLCR